MRRLTLVWLVCVACESKPPPGAELSRAQCADLVRRVHKLQSADTGGLRTTLNVGLRADIEGCFATGTERAYRCVLVAETMADLESCDSLFK